MRGRHQIITLIKQYSADSVGEFELEEDESDFRPYFEALGIDFSAGSAIAFLPGRLIVTNETSQNRKLEKLLSVLKDEFIPKNKPKEVKPVSAKEIRPEIYEPLKFVIPKVYFKNTSLADAVKFIKQETLKAKKPLNVIVAVKGLQGKINLDADDMPVGEVIKYICNQLGYKYRVDDYAIVLSDSTQCFEPLELAIYDMPEYLLNKVGRKKDIVFKKYLKNIGLDFPQGSELKVIYDFQKIMMMNTKSNNELFEFMFSLISGLETDTEKMLKIVVPRVTFRGTVSKSFELLREATLPADPEAPRLSIIYRNIGDAGKKEISLDFKEIPLGEIIRYICLARDLKYQVDSHAVVVSQFGAPVIRETTSNSLRAMEIKILELRQSVKKLRAKMLQDDRHVLKRERLKNRPIEKVLKLRVPKLRLKERSLDFVVTFLQRKSRDLSKDGVGLNVIVSDLDIAQKINLDVDNMPIGEVLRYICDQLNLVYTVEDYGVIIKEKTSKK